MDPEHEEKQLAGAASLFRRTEAVTSFIFTLLERLAVVAAIAFAAQKTEETALRVLATIGTFAFATWVGIIFGKAAIVVTAGDRTRTFSKAISPVFVAAATLIGLGVALATSYALGAAVAQLVAATE